MATTGELRAIVEELELIDIGDAATYLGEEPLEEHGAFSVNETSTFIDPLLNGWLFNKPGDRRLS